MKFERRRRKPMHRDVSKQEARALCSGVRPRVDVIVVPYREKTDGMTNSRQTLDSSARCPSEPYAHSTVSRRRAMMMMIRSYRRTCYSQSRSETGRDDCTFPRVRTGSVIFNFYRAPPCFNSILPFVRSVSRPACISFNSINRPSLPFCAMAAAVAAAAHFSLDCFAYIHIHLRLRSVGRRRRDASIVVVVVPHME